MTTLACRGAPRVVSRVSTSSSGLAASARARAGMAPRVYSIKPRVQSRHQAPVFQLATGERCAFDSYRAGGETCAPDLYGGVAR
jgi:hypothetical protein